MSLFLSSDRVEEPRQKGQSPPLSDVEQDRAEAESALGPPPTGPPSTVSRSGRVVYRAAKVSVCATVCAKEIHVFGNIAFALLLLLEGC